MLIKNAYLIDPASKTSQKADLRIEGGFISRIAAEITPDVSEEVIDASGLVAAPGTSVICMANTSPVVDNVGTLLDIGRRAKDEKIRIYQAASVSRSLKGEELTDMDELADSGACGFTDDGIPIRNAAFLYEAMEKAASLDLPISLHEEDPAFIKNNGINHGPVSDKLEIYGSPSIAEESLVARDCLLALRSGAHVVIQHISSGRSVELVRMFRSMGARLHAEATPHHFTLTEDAVLEYGTLAKMNPPLRTEKDRQAIIAGLADGTIDLIATDHAPHSREEKARSITAAPSGIIGLETSLALGITSLVRPGHLSLMQLLEKMTVNPARLYHLPSGELREGRAADVVLFDPEERWTPTEYASLSSNSPFTGRELFGKVKFTICGGEVVYRG